MNKFGQKIKKIRKDRGLTQQEFADSLGYAHKSTINKIESGQEDMSYQKILTLIQEYTLDVQDLFENPNNEIKTTIKSIENNNRHDSCIVYIHGMKGNANEAGFYSFLNDKYDVVGLNYEDGNPWEVKEQIVEEFLKIASNYKKIYIIANSLGAFFAQKYLSSFKIEKAFFISPFINMKLYMEEQLKNNKISVEQLREEKMIIINNQTFSYDFYTSLDEADNWNIKTHVVYGENDKLVDRGSIFDFVANHNASLSIMKNGEHYFHLPNQLRFIKKWLIDFVK